MELTFETINLMIINSIRDLIAQSNIEEAIDEMLKLATNSRQKNEVQALSARYHALKQETIRGTISNAEANQTRNNITFSLLQLLDELPDGSTVTVSVTKPSASSLASTAGAGEPPTTPPSGTGDGKPTTTGTGDGGSPHSSPGNLKLAFGFSIVAFAALLAITLLQPGWAAENNALFRTLLALAAAGAAATLPGFLNLDVGAVVKAGGALAAFALVFWFNPENDKKPFTLTVSIRVNKPSTTYPELEKGELWLWQVNDWKKASISPEGIADFKNLDPALIGKRTAVQLKANHYRLAADSLLIQPPSALLDLRPDGSLERVFGKVTDPLGNNLAGIIIEVENRFDTTDTAGNYEIRVPAAEQKTHYPIHARDPRKKGFLPYNDEAWPASGAKNFSMKK